MRVQKKPTVFSNKVRKLLIEYIKDDFDEFDESKLKYGFVSRMGMDPNTSYTSIIYFYYIIDLTQGQYRVYDIGTEVPQNELKGKLVIERGCTQATYLLTTE